MPKGKETATEKVETTKVGTKGKEPIEIEALNILEMMGLTAHINEVNTTKTKVEGESLPTTFVTLKDDSLPVSVGGLEPEELLMGVVFAKWLVTEKWGKKIKPTTLLSAHEFTDKDGKVTSRALKFSQAPASWVGK